MLYQSANNDIDRDFSQVAAASATRVLVCGLGSLGQYCVVKLKEFGVTVSGIDIGKPQIWDIPNLPDLLDELVIGDCRSPAVLEQVKLCQCRAVLLVSSDERVNIDAAFAIRVIHPQVRLVVRSAQQNLNELLDRQLGNFEAFAATQLSAPTFAIAALKSEIQGLIELEDRLLRVVQRRVEANHHWCDRRQLHELNNRTRRVLSHVTASTALPSEFFQWEADTIIRAGDTIAYIEIAEEMAGSAIPVRRKTRFKFNNWRRNFRGIFLPKWQHLVSWYASERQQAKQVAAIVGIAVLILMGLGVLVLKAAHPQEGWLDALYVTGVMLLGSYDTVFGALSSSDTAPLWLRFMNLSYMLAGTASIAVLYALLTESLLAAKFQLPQRRPPIPAQDHVVLIGLGRVGRQIATALQQLKQPLVGVSASELEPTTLPQMPLVVGNPTDVLSKVNLTTAKSIVVATDDEIANLEIGLMANGVNSSAHLVIRTFDPRFSDNLARILPEAEILCIYALAAEAFAAAAFGENILNLLRLGDRTLLVGEYNIQPGEPLCGLLLAEAAYGYGIVPLLYQAPTVAPEFMPSEDLRLDLGDRLIALVTVDSLHRLERGEMLPRRWQVRVDKTVAKTAMFEAARTIARISGCRIDLATEMLQRSPTVLSIPLYEHQAQRLVRELSKAQTIASAIDLSAITYH
jgi:Trk K+ transport system NAD-binding subunit